ncbi:ABC transporter ATP-binding protein [Tepidimicrobium xylanilyticum]|uniref:ATP-binding cassette, subfamily B n=1 Tax=Tepidimicrobium xylanilyticum TaxID=1123352 RepID=A0A1H2TQI0_9FIRM|nr:ABC transporter ATP-binding protein [Tepidimicrobium xylanilyticum]GMG95880.1 multidrug ABC transporter ATP-binding protein [Tepidimicrobium xylanilyticum]SDW46173.1 ATP-binding cassette, subfamily B [Tepidimicrobium xylanilyticum]
MLRRFISYYKPHKKLFFIDMFFAFLISAFDLIFPMVSRTIVNEIIPAGRMDLLLKWTIIMVILFGFRYISYYIVSYWGHVLGVYIEHDMRRDLFTHLQTLPFSYYDNTKTGHIMSRIVNDLRDITELSHHGPEDLFISSVMLMGSFILLVRIEWRLTLIIFAFIPLIVLFAMRKRLKMEDSFREVRRKIANVNAQLENSISGIRVAKSFTNEDYEIEKFQDGNSQYKEARKESYKAMAEFVAGMGLMTNVLNLIVISAGGYFVYRGYLTIGDLLAYTLYINFFMQPIRRLADFMQQYQDGMTGFERFIEVMNIEPDIKDKEDAIELTHVKGDIEFKNVSFSYTNGENRILSNLNLKIEAGKTVAIVGPSGAGKTTLCHLIPRFYDINEGEILVDGKNIQDITLKSLRKNIGIVQQDVFLFTGTIMDNISYGDPSKSEAEIIEAAKKARIHDFIMTLPNGYDTYIGEKGVKLSGGQKQRISIARLFLKDPPILILDEATSSLDNETEMLIQESLEELAKGRTTLIIAHRLSTIKNADEIVVLTNEGIEERGTHEELLRRGYIYAKLYRSQFRGLVS